MSKLQKAKNSTAHSRHFFEFIRSIGDSKSKLEEDKIVAREVSILKTAFQSDSTDNKMMRELVIRMVYCEMLGHNIEFGYIHAIKLISATEITQKRVGYMATWLSIPSTHELVYLIVANMQKDLKSPNLLEVCASLNAINKLIGPELIPCVLQETQGLLKHPQAPVRKKAILAIHSFYKKMDSSIGPYRQYRISLCDKDPQVMNGALMLIHDLAAANPLEQRDLVPSLVSILKQITEHRLTRDYDYHRVPAPWIQIRVMKILALLGAGDRAASAKMYDVLAEVLKRSDTGLTIGNALLYEMIRTVTTIVPHPELLDAAADYISKFLTSTSANLKYIGITALSRMVVIDPKHAIPHQHIVIDCLEDHDATIRRKTLNLLYAMTSARNVEVIVNRLTRYLESTHDPYLRADLVKNLCELIDKYSVSNRWYVDSMVRVLELGASDFSKDCLQAIIKLVAEGDGDDDEKDAQLRIHCVEKFYAILGAPAQQSDLMYELGAWIIGEYGYLSNRTSSQMMVDRLCDILERPHLEDETRGWLITACMKLIAQQRRIPDNIEEVVHVLKDSFSIALAQRCSEFLVLFEHLETLAQILPLDGCCEDIEVDNTLSFLDEYVAEVVQHTNGYYYDRDRVYGKKDRRTDASGLKIDAYEQVQTRKPDADLTLDCLQKAAPDKLQVNDSHKRWGRANLEINPEAEKTSANAIQKFADPNACLASTSPSQKGSGTADPNHAEEHGAIAGGGMVPKVRRSQKEKFASELFGALATEGMTTRPPKSGNSKNRKSDAVARPAKEAAASSLAMDSGDVANAYPHTKKEKNSSPRISSSTNSSAAVAASHSQSAGSSMKTTSIGIDDLFASVPPVAPAHIEPLGRGECGSSESMEVNTTVFTTIASYRQFDYGGPLCLGSTTLAAAEDILRIQVFVTLPARPGIPYDLCFNLNPRMMWQRLQCNISTSSVMMDHVSIVADTSMHGIIQLELGVTDIPWTGSKGPNSVTVAQLIWGGQNATSIQCATADVLRPLSMALEQFGTQWPSTVGEFSLPAVAVRSMQWPTEVAEVLLEKGHIKVVSVIEQELVAACRLMKVQSASSVLLHIRWNGPTADITVRCVTKSLSEAVAKSVAQLLQ